MLIQEFSKSSAKPVFDVADGEHGDGFVFAAPQTGVGKIAEVLDELIYLQVGGVLVHLMVSRLARKFLAGREGHSARGQLLPQG